MIANLIGAYMIARYRARARNHPRHSVRDQTRLTP
jgi:hypothetical protein